MTCYRVAMLRTSPATSFIPNNEPRAKVNTVNKERMRELHRVSDCIPYYILLPNNGRSLTGRKLGTIEYGTLWYIDH